MIEIIAATGNVNKVKEFKEILGNDYDVKSLKDIGLKLDVVEDADTFYGNALIKAKAIAEATGKIALADDSGLVVDALGGAPGVYSARYSGEDGNDVLNRAKLLKEMAGVENRTARFHAAIVLYYPDGTIIHTEGDTEGTILYKEEGENGFGYDSLFYSTDLNQSFGVADSDAKNAVSHRGRALKALVEILNAKE
ncbi:MAG: RdgB/HAM1 family non-canonical purine NTP pyrophosphatase [Clostridia bacterium]|nr:RdgB/HAM1 family non-canonical purine NTP pyrophosphatase [Clostridia bacterium]